MFWKRNREPRPSAPPPLPPLSAYESDAPRQTQWWTNDGLYLGYDTEPPRRGASVALGMDADRNAALPARPAYPDDRPERLRQDAPLLIRISIVSKIGRSVAIDPKGELFAHTALERGSRRVNHHAD